MTTPTIEDLAAQAPEGKPSHPFNERDEKGELLKQSAHDREHKCYGCLRQFKKAEQNFVCMREAVGVFRICDACRKEDKTSRLLGAAIYVGAGGLQNLSASDRDRAQRRLKKLARQGRATRKAQNRFMATTSPKKIAELQGRRPTTVSPEGEVEKDR